MMADHELRLKVTLDTSEAQEAIRRLKNQTELAHTILKHILSAEEKINSSESMHMWTTSDVEELFSLKETIKELCQEEMNKQ